LCEMKGYFVVVVPVFLETVSNHPLSVNPDIVDWLIG